MTFSFFRFVVLSLFYVVSLSLAKTPTHPFLQVTKDTKTLQYVTQISQRTPLVPVNLTLDLGGPHIWVNWWAGYNSSTYSQPHCGSSPCRLLNGTFCNDNFCQHMLYTPFPEIADAGYLASDVIKIQSTNGKSVLTVPRLYFFCGTPRISEGLASGVIGIMGLGRTDASLHAQLSSYFKLSKKFALCLSSSSGAVFFGDGPNTLVPYTDALSYTPLIINPIAGNEMSILYASPMYYIGVKSIKINGKRVKGFNGTLLSIDENGMGGTTISTIQPFSVLETSIYKAVVSAFVKAMPKNVKKVTNVAPFGACFSSKNIISTHLGPVIPSIDLELQTKNVWRIHGSNSMVEVKKNVLCLGFVEAVTYMRPTISVVIGGHQIEDNLLMFDLDASRLGFSSSLLGRSTSCSNFNFTSTA